MPGTNAYDQSRTRGPFSKWRRVGLTTGEAESKSRSARRRGNSRGDTSNSAGVRIVASAGPRHPYGRRAGGVGVGRERSEREQWRWETAMDLYLRWGSQSLVSARVGLYDVRLAAIATCNKRKVNAHLLMRRATKLSLKRSTSKLHSWLALERFTRGLRVACVSLYDVRLTAIATCNKREVNAHLRMRRATELSLKRSTSKLHSWLTGGVC
ncbi:uncharacterized protein LY89DRAFT_679013 [Mollisia scopiformis]|uniref:Uncharacterized protein n=1 Tax=Mollisia scopiformis TaxID=149040 RepID=A0A132B1A1_MOLSC|nr:uncharacterized protein LY89DRAFT_679013 [Mollisia scopiformis]KUJ06152.1 hypothetical protein LY89DRAFT_679013 [Mollisia scopiformis]